MTDMHLPQVDLPDPEMPANAAQAAATMGAASVILDRVTLLDRLRTELYRQDEKWGEQNHPDGTGAGLPVFDAITEHVTLAFPEDATAQLLADSAKEANANLVATGDLTWRDILTEEVFEAYAESSLDALQEELIQVAAVAIQWAGALERRRP